MRDGSNGEADRPRWPDALRSSLGSPGDKIVVRDRDSLWKLVSQRLTDLGRTASAPAIVEGIRQVAAFNGIADPDRIDVADVIDLAVLRRTGPQRTAVSEAVVPGGIAPRHVEDRSTRAAPAFESDAVLRATLERAVRKGYLPASELELVRERIQRLSNARGFAPDDFAQVALMESDGFNPRASNGRCFGVLQFCEGEGRGAESVGMRGRAAEISTMSVLEQLALVERYLDDVGRGAKVASMSLDDLYLVVLMPAARAQVDPHSSLDIPGRQARALHPGGDHARPITRTSIVAGLRAHAQKVLGSDMPTSLAALPDGKSMTVQRQALAAVGLYERVAATGRVDP